MQAKTLTFPPFLWVCCPYNTGKCCLNIIVSVEVLLLDNRCHMTGHQSANALSLTQPLANHRAADVDEGNLYEGNVGKSGLHVIGIGILTGIDHDGIFPEKVFIPIPLVEQQPVVAADKQGEAVLGEVFFQ